MPELGELPHHLQDRNGGCPAASHIVMLLPAFRVEGDIGEQIDGGFEYIERVISAEIMKAVLRVTPFDVAAVAFADGIQSALVSMTRNAVFIESDEHGVVIFLCPILGFLAAFVDELLANEGVEYLSVDASLLQQIGIYPTHRLVLRRQLKGLRGLWRFFFCRRITSAEIITQQHRHSLWVTEPVKLFYKANGFSALLGGMVEPLTTADGDAVVADKALIPAGCDELLPTATEELLQVHRSRLLFLCICEWNKFGHSSSFTVMAELSRCPRGRLLCVPLPCASPAICGGVSCRSAFRHR